MLRRLFQRIRRTRLRADNPGSAVMAVAGPGASFGVTGELLRLNAGRLTRLRDRVALLERRETALRAERATLEGEIEVLATESAAGLGGLAAGSHRRFCDVQFSTR